MSEYAMTRTAPAPALFTQFGVAQQAAERAAAAHGHRLRWTIWGSAPRCGNAVCERCGRTLLIQKTRGGQFRLEGSALDDCFQPSYHMAVAVA